MSSHEASESRVGGCPDQHGVPDLGIAVVPHLPPTRRTEECDVSALHEAPLRPRGKRARCRNYFFCAMPFSEASFHFSIIKFTHYLLDSGHSFNSTFRNALLSLISFQILIYSFLQPPKKRTSTTCRDLQWLQHIISKPWSTITPLIPRIRSFPAALHPQTPFSQQSSSCRSSPSSWSQLWCI
jgi:hypothetical protein